MSRKGCKLHINLEEETDKLREFVPDWEPERVDEAVRCWGIKIISVETETEYSALLESDARPVRAFAALRIAAAEGDFPDWAWSTFLNAGERKEDKPRFMALIAERLTRYLDSGNTVLVSPAAGWLVNVSKPACDQFPESFRWVTSALLQALAKKPESGASRIWQVDGIRDWMTTALNAPAGQIAQAVFSNLQTIGMKYADKLLALPRELRRHALVIFTQYTDWFYTNNREWSETNLLSALDSSDFDDKDAFWGGFLSNKNVNLSRDTFMRLEPYLLQLVSTGGETRRKHGEVLAGIILSKWGSIIEGTDERCISDEEFRKILVQVDDEFRSRVLQLLKRWSRDNDEEIKNKWTSLLPEFLRDVWPLQRKANSPTMSVSLCQLVLSNEELFPNLVDIILPCLTKIDDLLYRHYLPLSDNIAQKHPHQMLDLLYKVLPDETLTWPYDIEDILASVSEGEPTLRTNEKFLELKRRWDSR